jgi:hypothetical protein
MFHVEHPEGLLETKGKPRLPFVNVIVIVIVSYCTTTFRGMLWTTLTVVFSCDLV